MTIEKKMAVAMFTVAISAVSTQASAGILTNITDAVISTAQTVVSTVEGAVNSLLDTTYSTLTSTATKLDATLATLPSPLACAAAYSTLVNAANAQLSVDLQACAAAHVSTTDLPNLTTCANNAVAVSSTALDNALAATQACLDSHLQ